MDDTLEEDRERMMYVALAKYVRQCRFYGYFLSKVVEMLRNDVQLQRGVQNVVR